MILLRATLIASIFVINLLADTKDEIDHLLYFVSTSKCQYIRNGTNYSAKEAKDHISKKYNYYKDEIKTAEDFIRYSATKSELSGREYKVTCTNRELKNSNEWLLDELHKYRSKKIDN